MLHEEAILLQNQDRHITLPIIYVSFPLPQYIENPRYGPATTVGGGPQRLSTITGLDYWTRLLIMNWTTGLISFTTKFIPVV